MKAYVLHDGELEFIWSWEPEPQPSSEAPVADPAEISCNAATSNSTNPVETPALEPVVENLDAKTPSALSALDSAVSVKQDSDAQDTERQVKWVLDHTSTTESRVETSEKWVRAAIAAISSVVDQQEEEIQNLMEQVSRTENLAIRSSVRILDPRTDQHRASIGTTRPSSRSLCESRLLLPQPESASAA